jgi:hypothetical protein
MSSDLTDQIRDRVLDLLDDLAPKIPSKLFYRYHGVRILLAALGTPNWIITEKILNILIKMSQKDEELFSTIIMKDGNHHQLLNLLHRTKQKSDQSDSIKNIQQILNKILGIIEKPKPKKVEPPISQDIISEDLDLIRSLRTRKESIKQVTVDQETNTSPKTKSRKNVDNKPGISKVSSFAKRQNDAVDNSASIANPPMSRRLSVFKKSNDDTADSIIRIPQSFSIGELPDSEGPSQEIRKSRRGSIRRQSIIQHEYKNELPLTEESLENSLKHIEELLQQLTSDDLNDQVSAFNSLYADLRTQIYRGENYFWIVQGLLLYLQNKSDVICTLASKCLAQICEIGNHLIFDSRNSKRICYKN